MSDSANHQRATGVGLPQPEPLQPDPLQPDPVRPDPVQPDPAELAPSQVSVPQPTAQRPLTRRPGLKPLGYVVSVALGLTAYYLASVLNKNVPTYRALYSTLTHMGASVLWTDVRASLVRVGVGFAIAAVAGTVMGCLMGWYTPLRLLFEPWVQFIRMVPTLAFIPIVIIFFGIGERPKIGVIALAAFLAITVSVMVGVQNVDRTYIRAARTLGAGTGVMFRRVIVPATLPYILVGFRLGLANAWTTVVAAELLGASSGLGYLIENASTYNDTAEVIIAVICIGLIGLAMDQVMHYLERRLGSWQERAH